MEEKVKPLVEQEKAVRRGSESLSDKKDCKEIRSLLFLGCTSTSWRGCEGHQCNAQKRSFKQTAYYSYKL